jgi:hypothetical protein
MSKELIDTIGGWHARARLRARFTLYISKKVFLFVFNFHIPKYVITTTTIIGFQRRAYPFKKK